MARNEELRRLRGGCVLFAGSTQRDALGLVSNMLSTRARPQGDRPFYRARVRHGLIVFDRSPLGFYDRLTDRYRVLMMIIPHSTIPWPTSMPRTPLTACAPTSLPWPMQPARTVSPGLLLIWQHRRSATCAQDISPLGPCMWRLASIGCAGSSDCVNVGFLSQHSRVARARGGIEVHLPAYGI